MRTGVMDTEQQGTAGWLHVCMRLSSRCCTVPRCPANEGPCLYWTFRACVQDVFGHGWTFQACVQAPSVCGHWRTAAGSCRQHLAGSIDEEDVIAGWVVSRPLQHNVVEVRQVVPRLFLYCILSQAQPCFSTAGLCASAHVSVQPLDTQLCIEPEAGLQQPDRGDAAQIPNQTCSKHLHDWWQYLYLKPAPGRMYLSQVFLDEGEGWQAARPCAHNACPLGMYPEVVVPHLLIQSCDCHPCNACHVLMLSCLVVWVYALPVLLLHVQSGTDRCA